MQLSSRNRESPSPSDTTGDLEPAMGEHCHLMAASGTGWIVLTFSCVFRKLLTFTPVNKKPH